MPPFGELYGIANKVRGDLPETPHITDKGRGELRVNTNDEFQILFGHARRDECGHILDRFSKPKGCLDQFELTGIDFGKIKDVVDDRQKSGARLDDHVDEHRLAARKCEARAGGLR